VAITGQTVPRDFHVAAFEVWKTGGFSTSHGGDEDVVFGGVPAVELCPAKPRPRNFLAECKMFLAQELTFNATMPKAKLRGKSVIVGDLQRH
jgi:hypothetical protein